MKQLPLIAFFCIVFTGCGGTDTTVICRRNSDDCHPVEEICPIQEARGLTAIILDTQGYSVNTRGLEGTDLPPLFIVSARSCGKPIIIKTFQLSGSPIDGAHQPETISLTVQTDGDDFALEQLYTPKNVIEPMIYTLYPPDLLVDGESSATIMIAERNVAGREGQVAYSLFNFTCAASCDDIFMTKTSISSALAIR